MKTLALKIESLHILTATELATVDGAGRTFSADTSGVRHRRSHLCVKKSFFTCGPQTGVVPPFDTAR